MAVDSVTLKIEKGVVENMEAFVLMVCFEQILNPVYSPFPHHNRAFCLESSRWKKSIWHNWFLSWNEKHFIREKNCLGKSAFLYLNYMSTLFLELFIIHFPSIFLNFCRARCQHKKTKEKLLISFPTSITVSGTRINICLAFDTKYHHRYG